MSIEEWKQSNFIGSDETVVSIPTIQKSVTQLADLYFHPLTLAEIEAEYDYFEPGDGQADILLVNNTTLVIADYTYLGPQEEGDLTLFLAHLDQDQLTSPQLIILLNLDTQRFHCFQEQLPETTIGPQEPHQIDKILEVFGDILLGKRTKQPVSLKETKFLLKQWGLPFISTVTTQALSANY